MEMSVEDLEGDFKYVSLSGALDIDGMPTIDIQMAALAGAHKYIILDLADVDYISSIGIGLLVKNAQAVKRHGGQFIICRPTGLVEDVLRSVVIDKVIPIAATREEALAAITR